MTTVSQMLLSILVNACWQIALLTGIAAFCDYLLRRTPASYRHLLWVITLMAGFCLPIFTSTQLFAEGLAQNQSTQVAQAAVPVTIQVKEFEQIELPMPAQTSPENGKSFLQVNAAAASLIVLLYFLFLFRC